MRFSNLQKYSIVPIICFLMLIFIIPANATVYVVTDTINLNSRTTYLRASSQLMPMKGDPYNYSEKNLYDNDSTTCWMDGSQLTGAGEWLEMKFQRKYQFRGMIFGLGCRRDFICLGDYSVPAKIKLKIDEKPTYDFTVDWDTKNDAKQSLTRQEVNMRKAFLWFNCDTAYTTAAFQIKIDSVKRGDRYEKVSISDLELLDANDNQFQLMNILKNVTINPNDLGIIQSPLLCIGNDSPDRIKQYLDSAIGDGKKDSSTIDANLNSGMRDIVNADELSKLIAVLKSMFMQENRLVRYRVYGRTTTYMIKAGVINMGDDQWDIWRYIATTQTAKGVEVSIRYVPFIN